MSNTKNKYESMYTNDDAFLDKIKNDEYKLNVTPDHQFDDQDCKNHSKQLNSNDINQIINKLQNLINKTQ